MTWVILPSVGPSTGPDARFTATLDKHSSSGGQWISSGHSFVVELWTDIWPAEDNTGFQVSYELVYPGMQLYMFIEFFDATVLFDVCFAVSIDAWHMFSNGPEFSLRIHFTDRIWFDFT